jgi:hypothetical protein
MLEIVQDEFIVPQSIFFHIQPLVIVKMGDALGNFHGVPTLSLGLLKILTLADHFGYC